MKEFTLGDHASVFKGSGFNFVGMRDWEPGDRLSSIDWAQSSLTNFSPLITREFEQDSNATIVAVADASLSTRCGVARRADRRGHRRAVAAVGLSAVFFQDMFGLVTFDDRLRAAGGGAAAHRPLARDLLPRSVPEPAARSTCPAACATSTTAIEGQLRGRRSCR